MTDGERKATAEAYRRAAQWCKEKIEVARRHVYANGYMTALGEVITWCEAESKKIGEEPLPRPQ